MDGKEKITQLQLLQRFPFSPLNGPAIQKSAQNPLYASFHPPNDIHLAYITSCELSNIDIAYTCMCVCAREWNKTKTMRIHPVSSFPALFLFGGRFKISLSNQGQESSKICPFSSPYPVIISQYKNHFFNAWLLYKSNITFYVSNVNVKFSFQLFISSVFLLFFLPSPFSYLSLLFRTRESMFQIIFVFRSFFFFFFFFSVADFWFTIDFGREVSRRSVTVIYKPDKVNITLNIRSVRKIFILADFRYLEGKLILKGKLRNNLLRERISPYGNWTTTLD